MESMSYDVRRDVATKDSLSSRHVHAVEGEHVLYVRVVALLPEEI